VCKDHKRGIAVEPLGAPIPGKKVPADKAPEAPSEKFEEFGIVRIQFAVQLHLVSFSSAAASQAYSDLVTGYGIGAAIRTD
jgi:hypothetical protein